MTHVPFAPLQPEVWAGSEAEHLLFALDRQRTTFRWKADGLDDAGLSTRVGASSLTLGGLLRHLARAEDEMWTWKFSGARPGPPWDSVDWTAHPDWEFDTAAGQTPGQLYALYDNTVARCRGIIATAVADGGLDQIVHLTWPGVPRVSLRRLVCDLIEEYGRHTGHADLLREAVDARVGEDPPDGWTPTTVRAITRR